MRTEFLDAKFKERNKRGVRESRKKNPFILEKMRNLERRKWRWAERREREKKRVADFIYYCY